MDLEQIKIILDKLSRKRKQKLGEIIQEALEIGNNRPESELVGIGYDRYDRPEILFLDWYAYAVELQKSENSEQF